MEGYAPADPVERDKHRRVMWDDLRRRYVDLTGYDVVGALPDPMPSPGELAAQVKAAADLVRGVDAT